MCRRELAACVVLVGMMVGLDGAVSRAGTVSYYKFNNTAAPNVPDDSGNGHTGTFSGGAFYNTTDTPAGVGGAGSLQLTGASGSAVDLAGSFAALTTNNAATVMFWLKAGAQQQTDIFFGGAINGANREFSAHVPWDDNTVYFDTGGCCGATQRLTIGDSGDANNWHHWAFVKNGNDKFIYKDGALIQSQIGTATSAIGTINVAAIGNWNGGSSNPVIGLMDEVGIFSTALTGDQINNLMVSGVPEPGTAILLGWGVVGFAALRRRRRQR